MLTRGDVVKMLSSGEYIIITKTTWRYICTTCSTQNFNPCFSSVHCVGVQPLTIDSFYYAAPAMGHGVNPYNMQSSGENSLLTGYYNGVVAITSVNIVGEVYTTRSTQHKTLRFIV